MVLENATVILRHFLSQRNSACFRLYTLGIISLEQHLQTSQTKLLILKICIIFPKKIENRYENYCRCLSESYMFPMVAVNPP